MNNSASEFLRFPTKKIQFCQNFCSEVRWKSLYTMIHYSLFKNGERVEGSKLYDGVLYHQRPSTRR